MISNITRVLTKSFICELQNHCEQECLFVEITCRFTGCDDSFQRQHQQQHEETCSYKEDTCTYCNDVIKVSLIEVSYPL